MLILHNGLEIESLKNMEKMKEALKDITRTQSTTEFQQMTKDWRKEIWKTIKNTDGLYEVSNMGRVRSWNQRDHNRKRIRDSPKYLSINIDSGGYYSCSIVQNGKRGRKRIHRLLGIYFIDNPNNHPYVLHKNDIKTDIRLCNLYWGTQKQNINDSFKNGNSPKGEERSWAKMTRKDVKKIKALLKSTDLYHREIADIFNISRQTISDINNGRTWNHVECGSIEDYQLIETIEKL